MRNIVLRLNMLIPEFQYYHIYLRQKSLSSSFNIAITYVIFLGL